MNSDLVETVSAGSNLVTKGKTLGQIAYEAHGQTARPVPWQTDNGQPIPSWEELANTEAGQETRRRWEVTAKSVCVLWDTLAQHERSSVSGETE